MRSEGEVSTQAPSGGSDAAGDRGLLLARAAVGLAHEGKNPLHTMSLHVQLMTEKLAQAQGDGAGKGANLDRHFKALRDGIEKVDALLRAFSELAHPAQTAPDLAAAVARAELVLGFEARRSGVELSRSGPPALRAHAPAELLCDLVGHALLGFFALAREGGRVLVEVSPLGTFAQLSLRADGGTPSPAEAAPHLAAVRRLAAALPGCRFEASEQPPARLSLAVPGPA